MKIIEPELFRMLLTDVFMCAIGEEPSGALSENDYLTVAALIEETTGRSISEKTLRAYVRQVLTLNSEAGSGPSPFHLETLSQYVFGISGRTNVKGSPTWFQYKREGRSQISPPAAPEPQPSEQPDAIPLLKEQKPARRRILLLWVMMLFLAGAGVAWCTLLPLPTQPFVEDFNRTNPDSLRAHGWQILDYDPALFARQLYPDSMLTLWTLPGDYWVKKWEDRKITNMFVRKIEWDCFSVILKIRNFYPYQNNQQIALFLLDKDMNRSTWFNFSCHYYGGRSSSEGGIHLGWTYMENGEGFNEAIPIFLASSDSSYLPRAEWLRIDVNRQDLRVLNKENYDWNSYSLWRDPVHINFVPAYIGISAYQGWTLDDGTPKGADTIPVFIEELVVEPCRR